MAIAWMSFLVLPIAGTAADADAGFVSLFDGKTLQGWRTADASGDSLGVALFARGGPARVRAVKAWEMMPANPY